MEKRLMVHGVKELTLQDVTETVFAARNICKRAKRAGEAKIYEIAERLTKSVVITEERIELQTGEIPEELRISILERMLETKDKDKKAHNALKRIVREFQIIAYHLMWTA